MAHLTQKQTPGLTAIVLIPRLAAEESNSSPRYGPRLFNWGDIRL